MYIENLEFYRENLDKFVLSTFKDLKLAPHQEKILKLFSQKRARVSVHGGRGVGKSYLMAMIILSLLCLYDEIVITVLAGNILTTKDSLWQAVKRLHKRLPENIKSEIEILEESARRKSRRTDPSTATASIVGYREGREFTVQGRHSEDLVVIVDEASLVSNRALDAIYFSLTEGNNKMIMLGNPNKSSGYFYDSHYHRTKSKIWDKVVVSIYDAAGLKRTIGSDGKIKYKNIFKDKTIPRLVSVEAIKEMEVEPENSDTRRVYMLGLPPAKSLNALFINEKIKELNKRHVQYNKDLECVCGIVIGDALNPNVISYRIGDVLAKQDILLDSDMRNVVAWLDDKLKKVENLCLAICSFCNVNVFVRDFIAELEHPIVFLNEFDIDGDFQNNRAYAYQSLQKWIYNDVNNYASINDDDVVDNLCCIEGNYDGFRKISVEQQAVFRDRMGMSCNYADSFANTFLVDYGLGEGFLPDIFSNRKNKILTY